MEISYLELQKIRLIKNGLVSRFSNIETCVKALCGIQSQYQMYGIISIFNRVEQFKIKDFFENSNLLKSWGQRTTLHVYHKEDCDLISAIYKDVDNWVYKYAKTLGVDYKECLLAIRNYIVNNSKAVVSKKELAEILPNDVADELMNWNGILILATLHQILYGIINPKDEKLYSLNELPSSSEVDKSILVERYFKNYSPASISDFLHWSGLRKKAIDSELNEYLQDKPFFNIGAKKYYYDFVPDDDNEIEYPIILGKFDPLLVSYSDKKWILEDEDSSIIWKVAGQIEGVILTEKGLVGTWHYKLKSDSIVYEVSEVRKISQKTKRLINKRFKTMNEIFDKSKNEVSYRG